MSEVVELISELEDSYRNLGTLGDLSPTRIIVHRMQKKREKAVRHLNGTLRRT